MRSRIGLLAGAAALMLASLPTAAQAAVKVALLCPARCSNLPATIDPSDRAFLAGLERAGYVQSRNLSIDVSGVGVGRARLPEAARKLVERKVDVIVAVGNDSIRAAREATSTTPIVMVTIADAVEEGLVASLARPGANVTGLSLPLAQLAAQHIGLLKEISPRLARVAMISTRTGDVAQERFARIERAAETTGVRLSLLRVATLPDLEQALSPMSPERPDALLLLEEGKSPIRSEITLFALENRLATAGSARSFVEGGGLLAYGPYFPDLYERVAAYVGKILNGARPGDLPVEEPIRFELYVNKATAETIGLAIPEKLLMGADRVIE